MKKEKKSKHSESSNKLHNPQKTKIYQVVKLSFSLYPTTLLESFISRTSNPT